MKKALIIVCGVFLFWNCQGQNKPAKTDATMEKQTIYQFKVEDLSGQPFDFASLKGKKIMIVNTASKCGLTPQYKELETLYKEYGSKGFVIVGFPANNFAGQEPGTNEEIATFCQLNYGVTFPMFSKIDVNGKNAHPIYKYLKNSLSGAITDDIKWNFTKFLVDENGKLYKSFPSSVDPLDEQIISWLTK